MANVAIVTDSTACIPQSYVIKHHIKVLPFSFLFGDNLYLDDHRSNPDEFYRLLKESGKPPGTSPPSPGAYIEAYQELARDHGQILCVTLHAGLSSLYNSASTAAQNAHESLKNVRISVVDSRSASMAAGFVALAAAEASEQGASLEEVVRAAEQTRQCTGLLAVMDTLEYLARSKRIPSAAAWAGNLVNIKPILSIANGEVKRNGAALSKPQALRKIIESLKSESAKGKLKVAVVHTNAPEEAELFLKRVDAEVKPSELMLSSFTPAMGLYTGPGLIGAAYLLE
ncbi:MAG: DegV family protein [Dehalococcoidia bacterium]|nr:DegV family protein [Dehalococcoidia bacterium]